MPRCLLPDAGILLTLLTGSGKGSLVPSRGLFGTFDIALPHLMMEVEGLQVLQAAPPRRRLHTKSSPAPAPAGQRLAAQDADNFELRFPPAVFHGEHQRCVAKAWLDATDAPFPKGRTKLEKVVSAASAVALRQLQLGVQIEPLGPDAVVKAGPLPEPLAVVGEVLQDFASAMLEFHDKVQQAGVAQPLSKHWHRLARKWLLSSTVGHNAIAQIRQVQGSKRLSNNGAAKVQRWKHAVRIASQRTGIKNCPSNLRRGAPLFNAQLMKAFLVEACVDGLLSSFNESIVDESNLLIN